MGGDTPSNTLADSLINLVRNLEPSQIRRFRDGLNRFLEDRTNPSEVVIERNSYRNVRWREFVRLSGRNVQLRVHEVDSDMYRIFSSLLETIQSQRRPVPEEVPDLISLSSDSENYEDTYFPGLNLVVRIFEHVTDDVDN